MGNNSHIVIKANDRSYFAILKKEIHVLAVSAGFSPHRVGEIDIIVAEVATNLVKHAGGGQLYVRLLTEGGQPGIEIISSDEGPGMNDVHRMMSDGVSSKNTLGMGLGAIKRLSHFFQVYSMKGWGTVMVVRVFENEPSALKNARVEIRPLIIPKPGEEECGDGFSSLLSKTHLKLFLGDGLGHGPEAALATSVAKEAFDQCQETDPVEIIRHINGAVRKTRGLVGTVVVFDFAARHWKVCGVGNIATKLYGPSQNKSYLSYNGIIGLNVPRTLNAQVVPYEKGQYLLMCSDGIRSKWDTLRYTGITRCDLSMLPVALMKDFARNTDDMSVVACKINL